MLEQDLTYNFRTYEGSTYLEITRVEADAGIEQGGLLTGARVIISDMGVAYFQADGGPVDYADGDIFEEPNMLAGLLPKLGKGWHYCNGIPKSTYCDHSANIRYQPQHYTEEMVPNNVVRADSCKRWFYMQRPKKNSVTGLLSCPECNVFFRRVRHLNKKNDIPKSKKMTRLDVSSQFPFKFLYPVSAKRRRNKARESRKNDKRKLVRLNAQLEKTNVTLEEAQNAEMLDIVQTINEKYQSELEKIWFEADGKSGTETKELMKEIWNKDTTDRQDFYHDQMKNITGKNILCLVSLALG